MCCATEVVSMRDSRAAESSRDSQMKLPILRRTQHVSLARVDLSTSRSCVGLHKAECMRAAIEEAIVRMAGA